jgi:sigma-B regulation protein RsbU (phosphoserine phosphatase)
MFPGNTPLQETERLALLYRIGQTFNSTLDLDQVLNRIIDEVIQATRAERGFLMLGDRPANLVFRAARGLDRHSIDDPEFQVSRGVIERVVLEGQPLLASNAQDEDWLSGRKSVVVLGLRSILCVPMLWKGAAIGIIYVDNRIQAGIFIPADLELLGSIAASAAIAIENARLYELAVEKGRIERELQLAREVQASLLPAAPPDIPGWEFEAFWYPAREVAGDYYDFLPHGPNLGVVIADVSDKGMSAALYMAITRSIVRACLQDGGSPAESLARANRLICADTAADTSAGMFVTLFYLRVVPATGSLTYVNAGHNPPLHYQAAEDRFTRWKRSAMAMGVDESALVEERNATLALGDFVLFYTDGLTDALNPSGEEFGEERLCAILQEYRRQPAGKIMGALKAALHTFLGSEPPFDDITLILMKRL